jgi:hypothetical protein
MLIFGLETGEWKEGVARLEFSCFCAATNSWRFSMINNSSLQKWERLAQKQLNQQFVNEIVDGLQCSPFEANAILDTVYKVYSSYFETTGNLKPGQILFQVISIDTSSNTRLKDSKQTTVTLTLDAGEEDLKIREKEGVVGLRRHRIQRVSHETFQQGGLLTVEDLANRLFNCGERTICRDLQYFRNNDIILPLRSTIKDMGRAISHRCIIVKEWLRGKEYSEISRNTHHSVPAIKNYLSKFKRVVSLAEEGFDTHTIAFLVKLSATVVEEYYKLYRTPDILPHRLDELNSFLKKSHSDQNHQRPQ